jgi:dCMP deaminase
MLNLENITITTEERDRYLLQRAYKIASCSNDSVTKTGAVIVKNDQILIEGHSKFIKGTEEHPQFLEKPKKYNFILHAEVDAITIAAKHGIRMDYSTMYMPWLPCNRCFTTMYNSGIRTLVSHVQQLERSTTRWDEELNDTLLLIKATKDFNLLAYNGKIGGIEHLFDGEIWQP